MESHYYLAYGEYMALRQMTAMCPTAERIGTSYIRHWQLTFSEKAGNRVENIIYARNATVPIAIWQVSEEDRKALDLRYGGYKKLSFGVTYAGTIYSGYTYVLFNGSGHFVTPSPHMKDILKEGYSDNEIDVKDWKRWFF